MKTNKNNYPASCIVHTPSGPVACCKKHAEGVVNLMQFMGAHANTTELPDDDERECGNCANEAKANG